MKKAVIFSGAKITDYEFVKNSLKDNPFVACADSGVLHCINLGINVDLWVGDFDSASFEEYAQNQYLQNAEIVRLNPMKDDTDTEHTLDLVIDKGFDEIVLFGAIGNRFDHSLANIFLMEKAHFRGAKLTIINENNCIHYVNNSKIALDGKFYKYVSVIPLDSVCVSNTSMLYSLNNEVLDRASSRGISNEVINNGAEIIVKDGSALVIEAID